MGNHGKVKICYPPGPFQGFGMSHIMIELGILDVMHTICELEIKVAFINFNRQLSTKSSFHHTIFAQQLNSRGPEIRMAFISIHVPNLVETPHVQSQVIKYWLHHILSVYQILHFLS